MPWRSWAASLSLPRSRRKIGVPFRCVTTMAPISSSVCTKPKLRMTKPSSPRGTTLPPALLLLALMASVTFFSDKFQHELRGIELELELSRNAAKIRDIGDTGHLLQCRNDDPALDLGKFSEALRVGAQRVVEDFAGGRSHRV